MQPGSTPAVTVPVTVIGAVVLTPVPGSPGGGGVAPAGGGVGWSLGGGIAGLDTDDPSDEAGESGLPPWAQALSTAHATAAGSTINIRLTELGRPRPGDRSRPAAAARQFWG